MELLIGGLLRALLLLGEKKSSMRRECELEFTAMDIVNIVASMLQSLAAAKVTASAITLTFILWSLSRASRSFVELRPEMNHMTCEPRRLI